MLKKLYIKNYVLIDELEIHFSPHLNIITGETGAGKSIILGGLSLILGQRAEGNVQQDPQQKCILEGIFDVASYDLAAFFEQNELDYEPQTVIRREVLPSGKSRAFINDTPVSLNTLKDLSEQLVALHAQHQTLHLLNPQFHLTIVDMLAAHSSLLEQYRTNFQQLQANRHKLLRLEADNHRLQQEMDYVLFQLKELDDAELHDSLEQEKLERELTQLNNTENIKIALAESVNLLNSEEISTLQQLKVVRNRLSSIARYSSQYEVLSQRLESTFLELQDLYSELEHLADTVHLNEERAAAVADRLNTIYRLQKKHQLKNLAELIALREDFSRRSQSATTLAQDITQLQKHIVEQEKAVFAMAQQLSTQRSQQIPLLEQRVNALLDRVGMPNASVQVRHQTESINNMTLVGIDAIEILFAANKGSQHGEIRRVASGGELSRLMLCIQSLIADNAALPTLIFDEIDTGISGEVALRVGSVMQKLANDHQVICITHLPQIAAKGDTHFFVYKQDTDRQTLTRIRPLSHEERVVAIAQMLSGDNPGQSALSHATELLGS